MPQGFLSVISRLLPVLLVLLLAACQSGTQAQGGLPGLLDRVVPGTGAPQRVAPSAGTPANSQVNLPPAMQQALQQQLPQPASPSLAIETQPLPAAPTLLPPGSPDAIRVGFLAPLSGPNAGLGRALFDAAQLALFDLADNRLVLLPRDTEGNPEKASEAARRVIAEGAQIIIGPLFANEASAVGLIARERNIKVLSFSTDRSVAGGGVYLLGFTPDQQVERVISYARTRGLTRFAALAPDSPYGNAVVQAATTAVQAAGGQMLRQDRYPVDSGDLTPGVRRFAAALRSLPPRGPEEPPVDGVDPNIARPVDAVLLPEGGARLRALAPLLPFFDIDPRAVRFLGTGLWDDPSLSTEPALVGGWYAGPTPDGFAEFARRFEQGFGRRPPRLASLAYDATALVGILARRPGESPGIAAPFDEAGLTNPDGFAGYDGIFRFQTNGLVQRGLAVLEIQRRGGGRVIDPAPASFQVPAN
ncbi:penicillin-binding protein activator [Ferrovibrio sp.]|uniref:penicillin-binding protein activator n=1 Tax=Ferrovibrio sp. TaxID=1917215 RepID=UPI0025B9C605|nr:penicillin-binding protein activator [Ferrovibrio sp.]